MVPVHVVVVGCGRVGSELAVNLEKKGHSVAVLDKNPRSFRRLPEEWAGVRVTGFGFDRDHLEAAGAKEAGALAAVTSGDNSNILTARIARETYRIPAVVARIYDPRRAEIYQRLGISTVATVTWTTDQVMRRLLPDTATVEWTDPGGQLSLVERSLPLSWAGQALGSLDVDERIRLIAVTRRGTTVMSTDGMIGQEADLLHLAVASGAFDELEAILSGAPEDAVAVPARKAAR